MAFVHGKDTYISLNGTDLSAFTNASNLDQEVDSHDVTTYGASAYAYNGGLLKNSLSMSGVYDDTASGPKTIIEAVIDAGSLVTLIRRPEGTGGGLPQESVSVLVTKYTESNPVADMVTWSCDMQGSGVITRTTQ